MSAPDASPRIAICVVTFNSAELVGGFAASLPEGAAGTDWELVVADNDSHDDTLGELRRHAPFARIVRTGANLGFAGGVNAAIAAAGPRDAYLLVNADVRLSPGCVLSMYERLGPSAGIVVPRLVDGDGRHILSQRREPTLGRIWADALLGAGTAARVGGWGEIVAVPGRYARETPTDWAEGAIQLLSAECLRRCGPWDESFFLYSEETDYHLRARDLGLGVLYTPSATAQHLRGDSRTSPALWSLLTMNRVRLFSRRHGAPATAIFWSALVLRESSRALLGHPTSRAALRDLVAPRRWRQRTGPEWLSGVAAVGRG